jgi:hypothetical protein
MKLSVKQKNALFKVFLFGVIDFVCFTFYITISGLTGTFNWTVELLTTTPEGVIIQILNLIILVDGFLIFWYIVAVVIMFVTK